MTTLGKILAIVNLVLSVVVGAFIIMSYVARTNWHAAYNLVNAQLKVAQADATAYKDEVGNAQKVITRFEDEGKKTAFLTSHQGAATAELERRQEEVKLLHNSNEQYKKELANRQKDVETFRDRAVEMEITAKRTQEMNERLLVQLENTSKALALQRAEGTNGNKPGATKVNPPTEEVEGTIKQVDAQSGLVTISIGTDKGVRQGNTLDVYRLSPVPAYEGTIYILSARANEAVGRPTTKGRIPLQVGDRVASNVMSKRYGDQGNQGIR
jgi:hypothetical protein